MHEKLDAGGLIAAMFDLMRDNAVAVAASIASLSPATYTIPRPSHRCRSVSLP